MARKAQTNNSSAANLGFETELWTAADLLRGNIESAEYKHVILGLIFLKYVSDAFEERRGQLFPQQQEDPEKYAARAVFFLPKKARWSFLQANARQPTIGTLIDDAMQAIEDNNPRQLRDVLPRGYARPALDKVRLGQVIDDISKLGIGSKEQRSRDTLGRVYEYFLGQFASAEGRRGGEFYTPRCVVQLLVEMLEPRENSLLFDPCCGSGGMFIQSEKFIQEHGGRRLSVLGQELNHTTWRLCKMNLAIRGIEADIREGDAFSNDCHPDLKADFILANPPFNMSEWGGQVLRDDPRWKYGTPPAGNANYAWIQHFVHHLKPAGFAGFVLANGSLSNSSGEGSIRQAIVEADLVDCLVALPGQLFYTTQIPVCLWFLARNKSGDLYRRRTGETLFIDARKLGALIDRTHRELSEVDIARIAGKYHAWRGETGGEKYSAEKGFCASVTTEEIKGHGFVLTPGRYVGTVDVQEDEETFEDKMSRLTKQLQEQFAESIRLGQRIQANLKGFDWGK